MPDNSTSDKLLKISMHDFNDDISKKHIKHGLNKDQVEINRSKYGKNKIATTKKDTIFYRLKRSFLNPYSLVLLILAIISLFTDVIFAGNEGRNYITVIIISSMLIISGVIRFTQEFKAKRITDKLINYLNIKSVVIRDEVENNLDFEDIVVGDVILLKSGDRVPADVRIVKSQNLYISQAEITGESKIIYKSDEVNIDSKIKDSDISNIIYQGSSIISGSCVGIVIAVGKNTFYGGLKIDVTSKYKDRRDTSNSIIKVLIKFMIILIPLVFITSGLTKGDWFSAFLFSISVAVGITPELLPMVITACLAKGSFNMSKKQTIIKNINALESFGGMDVLCIDKTGTLTENSLILEYFIDILGNESKKVLDFAVLNSYFASGVSNHLDKSILDVTEELVTKSHFKKLINNSKKIDELSFDYNRKISSALVTTKNKKYLISKGDIEDIAPKCSYYEYKDKIYPIEGDKYASIHSVVDEIIEDGMKIIAIGYKEISSNKLSKDDENNLILLGYLVFFDAPKKSASLALEKLKEKHVGVKILTGDNLEITLSVCHRLNIDTTNVIKGSDLDKLDDSSILLAAEKNNIFTDLTPNQKARLVKALQINGHVVGFLGDGMNDLPAMIEADVGISVDSASPSLKEIATVILLKKDLGILEDGINEGRKSYVNMMKYVKITASSNFGNIISIIIASIMLPFFPMTAVQILLLNLLYDIICLVLPWDNVDKDLCEKPVQLTEKSFKTFMLFFGPISSIFDIITFVFLYFYLCPTICGGNFTSLSQVSQEQFVSIFQTGFFLESMWTQVLILHLLRTKKVPLIESRPSSPVLIVTLFGIAILTIVAMTPFGEFIGFTKLSSVYFLFLVAIVICYLLLMTLIKKLYVKKYDKLI